MSTSTPFIADGLWRCLCPSFRTSLLLRRSIRRPSSPAPAFVARASSVRCLSSANTQHQYGSAQVDQERHDQLVQSMGLTRADFARPRQARHTARYASQELAEPKFPSDVTAAYQELAIQARTLNTKNVARVVQHLVSNLGQGPNIEVHSALIQSQASASEGSAAMVREFLREMRQEEIHMDSKICHDILKVLSVHPDYLLRNEILEHMQKGWVELSLAGHHDVVAGLLRERQLELALDRLENMFHQGIMIEPWLLDLATYTLLDTDEVEEAHRLCQYRLNSPESGISSHMWLRLLEKASENLNHPATEFVWFRQVQTKYLNPPEGVCLNVLMTAARCGASELAIDVFRALGERGTVYESQHYEMLAEAHLRANDLRSAISIMCIAHSAGILLDDSATSGLHTVLSRDSKLSALAFGILQSLKDEGRDIPVTMVNSVIGATTHKNSLDDAIEQYKAMRSICPEGPSVQTFNILLKGCRREKRKNLAMFLASEMLAAKVKPNELTYERMIETCIACQDMDDALLYLDEMEAQKMVPKSGTVAVLLHSLAERRDPRHGSIEAQLKEMGVDVKRIPMNFQLR